MIKSFPLVPLPNPKSFSIKCKETIADTSQNTPKEPNMIKLLKMLNPPIKKLEKSLKPT